MPETPTLRVVVFRVGDLVCAAPAGVVREILPALPATRIPGVGPAVEGLVNVRGMLLTVVDAHRLLGRPGEGGDDGAVLLLSLDDGRLFGLAVTQVLDFLEVPAEAVAARQDLPGVDPRLVRAVGQWDDRHFIVLDFDALLGPIVGRQEPAAGGAGA